MGYKKHSRSKWGGGGGAYCAPSGSATIFNPKLLVMINHFISYCHNNLFVYQCLISRMINENSLAQPGSFEQGAQGKH